MNKTSAMIKQIQATYPESSISVKDVVDSILHRNQQGRNYFTLTIIRDGLSISNEYNKEIFNILIELASPRYNFLTLHFNFINDDGEPIEIDGELYYESIKTGTFFDPEKGTEVENYLERIFPFFKVVSE